MIKIGSAEIDDGSARIDDTSAVMNDVSAVMKGYRKMIDRLPPKSNQNFF